mmetsp:Transcript_66626/g.147652  ORF Transcript_66626/g.147652 Transcript_66626/m.147652 type:complete len:231 (+) Transcript_66626:56-748(+)
MALVYILMLSAGAMARAEETSPSPVCAGLGEDGSSCAQATVGAALLQIQNRVSAEKVNETDEDGQPSGQYFQSSGKCEKVNTYDECAKLAKAIGAPGGDVAGVSRRRKSPTGCYQFRNTVSRRRTRNNLKVYYASGDGDCTGTRTCLCKPEHATIHDSGYCAFHPSPEQCNAWAAGFGTPGGRAHEVNNDKAPRGCYQYHSANGNNLKVYWNRAGRGTSCTSTRACICHA